MVASSAVDILKEISLLSVSQTVFGCMALGWAFLTYRRLNWPSSASRKAATSIAVAIGVFFVAWGAGGGVLEAKIRLEYRESLKSLRKSSFTIDVNGHHVAQAEQFVGELLKLTPVRARRSSPVGRYHTRVSNGQRTIELVLRRDSRVDDELWVHWRRGGKLVRIGTLRSDMIVSFVSELDRKTE